jgi:Tol biopolymer transport system component
VGHRSDTKEATRITEGTQWTVQGAPSWSPDGKQFVFGVGSTPMLRDNRRDIYLATLGQQARSRKDQHQLGQRRHAALVAGRRDDSVGQ